MSELLTEVLDTTLVNDKEVVSLSLAWKTSSENGELRYVMVGTKGRS